MILRVDVLVFGALQLNISMPAFRRKTLPPSSGLKNNITHMHRRENLKYHMSIFGENSGFHCDD